MGSGTSVVALVTAVLLVGACQSPSDHDTRVTNRSPSPSPSASTSETAPMLMPDLVGRPETAVTGRLGRLDIGGSWASVTVRCGLRPGTVVHQRPAAGTPLESGTTVQVRTAALDLDEFRGPCEPRDGDLGPVTGPDAAQARQFYRFASDPTLGAPFASGEVWTGIEDGLAGVSLDEAERARLAAWRLDAEYAERGGPFSALDVLASSGGYYELHHGISPTCPGAGGNDQAPPGLVGLRAVSLIAPRDVTSACMQWWAVTLFVDGDDLIRGVALRLGSP